MLIGITGGIGAGKSVVSRILRLQGYQVYDCDMRARRLMEQSEEIRSAIALRMGEQAIDAEGHPDRRYIAGRIFADDDERAWLNALVHGEVRKDIRHWAEQHKAARMPLFIESAIMRTSALDRMCDEIWVVEHDEDLRLRRVLERDNITADECRRRMAAQQQELDFDSSVRVRHILNDGLTPLLSRIDLALR